MAREADLGRRGRSETTSVEVEPRRHFIAESIAELRKVEWPNQRQLVSATVAVIIAVVVVGAFLYVTDEAFSRLVRDVLLNI